MAVGRAQVSEWLRSMNLEHYIQAFLDNGYDDMHVCRQIGHLDLDAIGVHDQDSRQAIFDQLQILLEKDSSDKTGTGPVYFTLENPEYDDPPLMDTSSEENDDADVAPSLPPREYKIDPTTNTPVDSLVDDDQETCLFQQSKCKEDLNAVEMPMRDHTHGDGVVSSNSYHGTPSHHLGAEKSSEAFSDESAYLSGAGSLEAVNKDKLEGHRPSRKTSTLGRLFRQKRPGQKHSYKQHKGDLNASEITMSANQRIQLMQQVKQGKLSQEDVLEKVRIYEEQKRLQTLRTDITPSHGFEGAIDQKDFPVRTQKLPRKVSTIPSLFRSKILPFLQKRHLKDGQNLCDLDRKGSHPVPHSHHDDHERRGSLPAPPQGTATETSSADFEDLRASPEHIRTITPEHSYRQTIHLPDPEMVAMFKDGRLLKQRPIRRCQEDSMDLNSDGMSQGESERTASSSLESVHSCSGGVPSLSSSSSQGSMTFDDSNISRHPLCLARVLVDYVPSPYDKDSLKLKKGELIQVLKKNASGTWLGRLDNKIGSFKFINVELLSDEPKSPCMPEAGSVVMHSVRQLHSMSGNGECTVEALLNSLHLQDLVSVFLLNGYMTLDDLKDLTEQDLDDFHVCRAEDRSKIMTTVQLINSGQATKTKNPTMSPFFKLRISSSSGRGGMFRHMNPFSNSVMLRESSETQLSTAKGNVYSASSTDNTGTGRTDISSKYQESQIPSLISRTGQALSSPRLTQKHKFLPHHRQVDSGFEGKIDSVHDVLLDGDGTSGDFLNVTRMLGRHRLSSELKDYSLVSTADCDNLPCEEYRSRAYSQDHQRTRESASVDYNFQTFSWGSPTRIQCGKTTSFDRSISKGTKLPSRKSHKSRKHLVSVVDSAYSSAPNTPVLQRSSTKQRSPRHSQIPASQDSSLRTQDGDLMTMYPHLVGVKTAHIRSLTQTASRSAPCSPAVVPRMTPAARSSVHAHPRAGKPPRLRQKGVEAKYIEPKHFSQGDNTLPLVPTLPSRGEDSITMATILKTVGLSQYEPILKARGITTRKHFLDLKEKDLRNLGIKTTDHLHRLLSWQQHLDLGEMRSLSSDPSSRAHRVSTLRDKV